MVLTTIKDLDFKILNMLNDTDILYFCLTCKEAKQLFYDDTFWSNRVIIKYMGVPKNILYENKGKRTWMNYYVNDLRKISFKSPNDIFWKGIEKCRNDYILIALDLGIDINIQHALFDNNALMNVNEYEQIVNENIEVNTVNLLIEKGININYRNKYNETPLILFVKMCGMHLKVVRLLLEKNVDVNIQDTDHGTALMYAVERGKFEIVKLLLDNGADPNLEYYDGKTAADFGIIPSNYIATSEKAKRKLEQNHQKILSLLTNYVNN